MFRFRRLALELDCAVETIVWDIFIGNWQAPSNAEVDVYTGELLWGDEEGNDLEAADVDGFSPTGDY